MIPFRKDPKKTFGFQVVAVCMFIIVVALFFLAGEGKAGSAPKTVAEIALYQGEDREKILIEGAKKEGQLTFYNSLTWLQEVANAFEKKYPFIKPLVWRSNSMEMTRRVTQEHTARRFLVDVVETTDLIPLLHKEGILQEYYSPELRYYPDESKLKGKTGVYYWADREIYIGLGFNTQLVPPAEAPESLKDLLDPKWKGKMSITGTKTGITWLGNALDVMGRDFIEKLSRQDVKVHNLSGVALEGLIVSGEVPLSPSVFNTRIIIAKRKGAPVEWVPLEPVVANVGYSGLAAKAPHPHAALLFLDFIHSSEGQRILVKEGSISPREDIESSEKEFKKTYFETKYSFEEFEKKFDEWEKLLMQLFIRKK